MRKIAVILVLLGCRGAFGNSLQDAIRNGDTVQVRALVDSGTDLNANDSLGATPLHDAVWSNRLEIVRFLLDRGAAIDARHSDGGSTPLHYAVIRDDLPIAQLLIARGADVNATYRSGVTALQLAASRGNLEMVRLLIDSGANVN